jgi:hypothetical protein
MITCLDPDGVRPASEASFVTGRTAFFREGNNKDAKERARCVTDEKLESIGTGLESRPRGISSLQLW